MANLIGQTINHYHIIEQLGEGGMATVYKAFDTHLERPVAIKVIRQEAFSQEIFSMVLARFEREAKALAQLSHPYIVKVYDYGEYEGSPFLVMEYIPGGTLKNRTGKAISWREAVRLLLPVAGALKYAHDEKIIHRDIKPGNILITSRGEPILSDFGIAKILENTALTTLTGTGVGIGTPEYMAPEQGKGGEVDGRADVYSLGVVLYELVTGRRPYIADTPLAVLLKHMNDPLPRPREFVPDLPDAVEQVLFKALAKQPQDRYSDMGAFAQALEKLISSEVGTLEQGLPISDEQTVIAKDGEERKKRNGLGRLPIALILIGIVFLAGTTTFAIFWGIKYYEKQQEVFANNTQSALARTDLSQATGENTEPTYNSTQTTVPPTATIAPSPTIILSPTLGIGSTQISNKDGMVMVFVPQGEFLMGADPSDEGADEDEYPQHTVFLNDFWIDQTEVTNAMYSLCVTAGACHLPQKTNAPPVTDYYYGNPLFDQYPVIYVSWDDAVDYCTWAERRLPTEAEWEKAARGSKGLMFPWGNQAPNGSFANLCDESCPYEAERDPTYNDGYPGVSDVGVFSKGASPSGALDMSGNVNEWVADFYLENYYSISPSTNPTGPMSGILHVLRGGAAVQRTWYARTSHRAADWPNSNYSNLGFRCATSP